MKTDKETGVTLEIIADADCESPVEGDEAVRFVVLHRRYSNPAEAYGLATIADVEAFEVAAGDDWAVYPLYMYDHGQTVYRPSEGGNPFSCPWDSGRVGIIALKRDEFSGDTFKAVEAICRTYTDWANGECYGFTVEGPEGDVIDICFGFIGREHAEEAGEVAFRFAVADAAKGVAREIETARPDMYCETVAVHGAAS